MSKQSLTKKVIHIMIVCVIIIAIMFTALIFALIYYENGESNMPFDISKVSIISTVDGQNVENQEYRWSINAIQNNDIYIYIEKNENYNKQESIKSIKIEDLKIIKNPSIGEIKIYKPISDEKVIFKNVEENIIQNLEYIGTKSTNMKNLEISNQGGVITFRCANNNIGTYTSNDDAEINYEQLIKKLNINEEDIEAKISFDVIICLDSGKIFKANDIDIKIPNENIVSEGTVGNENCITENIVFKRIKN